MPITRPAKSSGTSVLPQSNDFSPVAGSINLVDTSTKSVTATLPENPGTGDLISIFHQGTFAINPITLLPGGEGHNIDGQSSLTVDDNISFGLRYTGSGGRWETVSLNPTVSEIVDVNKADHPGSFHAVHPDQFDSQDPNQVFIETQQGTDFVRQIATENRHRGTQWQRVRVESEWSQWETYTIQTNLTFQVSTVEEFQRVMDGLNGASYFGRRVITIHALGGEYYFDSQVDIYLPGNVRLRIMGDPKIEPMPGADDFQGDIFSGIATGPGTPYADHNLQLIKASYPTHFHFTGESGLFFFLGSAQSVSIEHLLIINPGASSTAITPRARIEFKHCAFFGFRHHIHNDSAIAIADQCYFLHSARRFIYATSSRSVFKNSIIVGANGLAYTREGDIHFNSCHFKFYTHSMHLASGYMDLVGNCVFEHFQHSAIDVHVCSHLHLDRVTIRYGHGWGIYVLYASAFLANLTAHNCYGGGVVADKGATVRVSDQPNLYNMPGNVFYCVKNSLMLLQRFSHTHYQMSPALGQFGNAGALILRE